MEKKDVGSITAPTKLLKGSSVTPCLCGELGEVSYGHSSMTATRGWVEKLGGRAFTLSLKSVIIRFLDLQFRAIGERGLR